MKSSNIIIKVEPSEVRNFTFAIYDVWGYVKLLMNVLQFIMSYAYRGFSFCPEKRFTSSYIKISSNDSSRIFVYISKNKYISVINPFNFQINGGIVTFRLEEILITERVCAEVLSIVSNWENSGGNRKDRVFDYLTSYDDEELNLNSSIVLERLLLMESGYIRHDDDFKSENGHKHPRTHLDINYSKKASFKVGTYRMFECLDFESIFCKNKACKYLNDYTGNTLSNTKAKRVLRNKKNRKK